MSQILIEQLEVETIIGVNAWEREVPQSLALDLALSVDLSAAARSDDVSDTIDYGLACELIRNHLAVHHYQLIERLAAAVGDCLLEAFPTLTEAQVRVRKYDVVPGTRSVGVSILRRRAFPTT